MMLPTYHRHVQTSIILLLSLTNIGFGYYIGNAPPTGAGAVGICYFLLLTTQTRSPAKLEALKSSVVSGVILPVTPCPIAFMNSDDPVERMVGQSRYALLLRRQVVGKLSEEQFRLAMEAFQQGMSLVPEGDVDVGGGPTFTPEDSTSAPSATCCPLHVEPFFLDRYPVTNRQYYEFVAGGGYHEMALWDKRIWPAVLDMVDRTGLPGPRFWRNGCYLQDEEDLPVVGISWYEAEACARWLCKRLPTDAEWIKATAWPISIDAKTLVQRRYPWGDAMDHTRANVWESGHNRIVSVRAFAEGASVGGIYQLIGNVWEWTDGDFLGYSDDGKLELSMPMKSIRGGAFDTYFDNQANAQFQSGENSLSRRHNIGFRCAIAMRDIVLVRPASESPAIGSDGIAEEYKETAT